MEDKNLNAICFRKKVLTIAGSDCSGGAGIQADLKTMSAHALYGMSVITAITVQNTTGVVTSEPVNPSIVAGQIDAVCSDIMPDAVKTGMLFSEEIINVVSGKIKEYGLKNLVVDPVFVSTSGSQLLKPQAAEVLKKKLLPLAMVITPNIPEAQALTGISINNKNDMLLAASGLCRASGANVLVKGGHNTGSADDLLYCTDKTALSHSFKPGQDYNIDNITIQVNGNAVWFMGERIDTSNTHGTGCTLSSAIACNLASGMDIITAIASAKSYLTHALKAGLKIGHGNGPVDHCWNINAPKHT
ncbi:MAG: bifunctional hydroxymethylpyrimidine kinase/phosphomethylpyrimidine kinase [Lachnospiraceae bacterium]|nr:bifunctional hydroxymethylpyrimidine kinase/phosphomethylpyrimidine kinase [Lachnospiraceae bacterium]